MKNRSTLLMLSLACGVACVGACVVQTDPVSGPRGDDGKQGAPWTCQADAGCICVPATAIDCYTGPTGTQNVGMCHGGVQVCKADGTGFGDCLLQVTPAPKDDCSTTEDDNCDGQVNEAPCVCIPAATAACYEGPAGTEGVGRCRGGTKTCVADGMGWGSCDGEILPAAETCATIGDDDCNGQVNEGGSDCACVPGSLGSCYSGPAGTEGVGICKGGTQVCKADGTGYGACVGGVVPVQNGEDCATPVDDNCDGQVNEESAGCVCTPDAALDCPYAGPQGTEGIGVCRAGTHTCNAQGTGYLSPCSGELVPSSELCGTLADENCDGDMGCHGLHVWSKRFGDLFTQEARGIAVDAADNVVVTGYFKGTADFGGGPFTVGYDSAFVAKFTSEGMPLWSKSFIDIVGNNDYGGGIAVDGSNNIFITGYITGKVDFGCGALTAVANSQDIVVVKFDPAGACQWSKSFGDAEAQIGEAIAIDGDGDVIITGKFAGTVAFSAGPLVSAGSYDIFLAKLDGSTGNTLWSQRFGDANDNQDAYSLAIDSSDSVLLTGQVNGAVNFGQGVLVSAGLGDVFVAKFDTAGIPLWSKLFGDAENQFGQTVSTAGGKEVLVTGAFRGTVDFGGGTLTSAGSLDIFVAKLDSAGNHLWSKRFGDASGQFGYGIAENPTGDIIVTSYGQGTVDFGGAPLAGSFGSNNIMVAKFDGNGNHVWSRRFGNNDGYPNAVAVDGYGNTFLAGEYSGVIDFGGGPLVSAGYDLFITKLSP